MPQQFFPSSDRPELLVDLTLARNASIYASERVATRLEKLLAGDADIDHWSTYIGQGAVRFYLPLNVQLPNDFFSQLVIVTKSLQARERVRARLDRALTNSSRRWWRASRRSSSGRRWAGRCSTASAGPIRRR